MNSTKVCRTCLNGNINEQMQYLYDIVSVPSVDNPVTSTTTTTLSDMLTTITTTTISKSDQLPTNICRKCADNIKSFFEFKKQCEKSFDTLKIMLTENVGKKSSKTIPDSAYDIDNDDDSYVGIEDWPPFENEIQLTRQYKLHETGPNDKQTQTEEFLFHPCEVCNEKFVDERLLKKHRSGHIEKKCRICNKEFITFSSLRRHLRNVHSMNALSEKFDEIKCKECNKLFRNNTMFIQHLESYTNCGTNLENIGNAKRITDAKVKRKEQIEINASKCGLITVQLNVNGQWECNNCKNVYDNENELRKHHCILNIKLTGTTPTKTETDDVNNIVKTENIVEPLALMNMIYKNSVVVKEEHNNDCNSNFEIVFPDTISINNVDAEFKNEFNDLDCKNDYVNSDSDDDYNPKNRVKQKKRTNKNVAEKSHSKTYNRTTENPKVIVTLIEPTLNEIELNDHQSTSSMVSWKSTPTAVIEKRQKPLVKKIKISCNLCKLKFIDFGAFARHKKTHTKSKQKVRHICEVCNKEYSRKHALTRHRTMQHSDATPYECDICKKAFKIQYYLTLHKLVHSEERLHCNICDIKFKCALDLTVHRKKQHIEEYRRPPIKEKPVVCDICSKGFTRKRTLKYHMKRHTVTHFYKCQYCTEKFNTKQEQMEHLKEHPNELRPYLCTECGLSFSKNTGFIVHMRRHRGEKPFRCTFCDKGFSRHSDLLQHEHYHTDNKPFICSICGKAFHRRTALKVHTRTHTGERPYKCTYCTKAFTQSNDLKVHIRRHTGEVFKCEFCASSYIQQYLLSKHKLKVHGIKVESISGRLQKFQPIYHKTAPNSIPVVMKQ